MSLPGSPAAVPSAIAPPLWRAVAVFRAASLVYAAAQLVRDVDGYARPSLAVGTLIAAAAWTWLTTLAYRVPERRGPLLLGLDLLASVTALLLTRPAQGADLVEAGTPTLPASWVVGAVLAWALTYGWRGGVVAATAVGAAVVSVRGSVPPPTVNSLVLLLLVGAVVGYAARLALDAEATYAAAVRARAAVQERERLARSVHDGVLQVLALVARRARELGGPAAELGHLADEQERALRRLVASAPAEPPDHGTVDLRALLLRVVPAATEVAAPADPVLVPTRVGDEVAAAVRAALDNVGRHCPRGTRSWVFLEDEPDAVTVSVRDDGPGIPAERLATAEAEGRLGVSQSVRARLATLGGTATISSVPGAGTEVELRVPR